MIRDAISNIFNILQPQITANDNDIDQIQGDIVNIQTDITNIQNQFGDEMPLGSIIMYATGGIAPNNKWMFCEGQTLDNTVYPDLFAIIGYTFGGAGTDFSLPDTRKKFIAGYDDNGPAEYQTIGAGAGANDVTLTGAQSGIADHNHGGATGGDGAHSHTFTLNYRSPSLGGLTIPSLWYDKGDNENLQNFPGHEGSTMSNPGDHTHTISGSGDVAASEAHENRPEFVVFPHIIKVMN
jgi:microcystin-dependent protein